MSKMNLIQNDEFVSFLKENLEKRQRNNSRYSIRAYASFLGVDQSTLSKVLQGKTNLSTESMRKCLLNLNASDEILISILGKHSTQTHKYDGIEDHVFEVISNWQHFAILELMSIPGFSLTPENVAKRLRISVDEAELSIDRLIQFDFITYKDGRPVVGQENHTWTNFENSNEARKLLQKNLLEKSIDALDTVPFELRDHSSLTVALDKGQIQEYKAIMKKVRVQLAELFQKSQNFDEVYQVTISLYPLTHSDEN